MPVIEDGGTVIGIVTVLYILRVIKEDKNLDELSSEDIMIKPIYPKSISHHR